MTVLLGSQHQSVLVHSCLLNPIPCHGWRHCSHLPHCWLISPARDHWSSYSLLSTHPWGPCLSPSRACVIRTHNGVWRSVCESSGGLRAALNPRAVRCLFLLCLLLHCIHRGLYTQSGGSLGDILGAACLEYFDLVSQNRSSLGCPSPAFSKNHLQLLLCAPPGKQEPTSLLLGNRWMAVHL